MPNSKIVKQWLDEDSFLPMGADALGNVYNMEVLENLKQSKNNLREDQILEGAKTGAVLLNE